MKVNLRNYDGKEIIKFIREDTDLSQKDFAKSIGKSRSSIQDYEYGDTKFYFETFLEIIKQHGYDVIIEKKTIQKKDKTKD